MVTLQELKASCPAVAWTKHRFCSEVELGHGGHIIIRYDVPQPSQQRPAFDPQMVATKFKDILGLSADDKDTCAALSDLLNLRMEMTYKAVAIHIQLAMSVLDALTNCQMIKAWLFMRELVNQLIPYRGELNVYQWPQWIFLVEAFIFSQSDEATTKIIENLYKMDEIE